MKPHRLLLFLSSPLGALSVCAQGGVDIQPLGNRVEVLRPQDRIVPLKREVESGVLPVLAADILKSSPTPPPRARTADDGRNRTGVRPRQRAGSVLPNGSKVSADNGSPRATTGVIGVPPPPSPPPSGGVPTTGAPALAAENATTSPMANTPSGEPSLAQRQAQGDTRLKAYDADIAKAMEASAAGRRQEAMAILVARWEEMVEYEDFGSLGKLAYMAAEAGDEALAIRAARKAAELVEDDEFYEILANILIRFGRLDEAAGVLAQMDPKGEEARGVRGSLAVNRAKVLYERSDFAGAEAILEKDRDVLDDGGTELLAWVKYRREKFDEAAQIFGEAYRKTRSESSAQGIVFSLHRAKRYDLLLDRLKGDEGPLSRLVSDDVRAAIVEGRPRLTVGPDGRLALAQGSPGADEIRGWHARAEVLFRSKRGTTGEGRLTQTIPATTLTWYGERDRLSLRVEGHRASDGAMSTQGMGFYGLWQREFEEGWSARVGLGRSSAAAVTSLGTGQPWIGEIGAYYFGGEWGIGVSLARRPVQESLLSLSGKPAFGANPAWGQVLQTGLTVSGNHKLRDWALSLSATWATLEGTRVANNDKFDLYGRALKPVPGWEGLQMGPEMILTTHRRNLSAYQSGHGGYFSPRLSAQLGWVGVYDRAWQGIDWHLEGGLGYNWNRQSAAPANPLTGAGPGAIAAATGQGLVYRLLVDASRPLTRQWKFGVWTEIQKSANYQDWRAGIYTSGPLD